MLHLIPLRRKARQEQAIQPAPQNGDYVHFNGGTLAYVYNADTRNPYNESDPRTWLYLLVENADGSIGSEYLPVDAVRLAVQS